MHVLFRSHHSELLLAPAISFEVIVIAILDELKNMCWLCHLDPVENEVLFLQHSIQTVSYMFLPNADDCGHDKLYRM